MSYPIVLLPSADAEVFDAANFYKEQKTGLGFDFLNEMEEAKLHLSQHPQFYSYITSAKTYRSFSLNRFPHKIVFRIHDDTVIINAVRHDKRKPLP